MDFWASLEHKIYYKYNQDVPSRLLEELKNASLTASALDQKMERIHDEVGMIKEQKIKNGDQDSAELVINNERFIIPEALLQMAENSLSNRSK